MKKLISIVLTVALTFVFSVTTTFAGTQSQLKYVALGSSTASGYGLAGYVSQGVNSKVETSYPRLFQKELGISDENFTNLCVEGQRTTEVRAILDPEYRAKILNNDAFLTKHIEYFKGKSGYNKADIDGIQAYYEDAISNADIITVDICENDFGTYLGHRTVGMLTGSYQYKGYGDFNQNIYDDIDEIPSSLKTALKKAEDKAVQLLEEKELPADMIKNLVDMFAYCGVSCCVNFSANMEKIYKLNPDAKVVVFGVSNLLRDTWVNISGETIDLGEISKVYMTLINTYIRAIDKNSYKYKFANCFEYETVFEEITESDIADIQNEFVDKIHSSDKGQDISIAQVLAEIKYGTTIGTKDNSVSLEALLAGNLQSGPLAIYINAKFLAGQSLAPHPSVEGHQQKYDALVNAYYGKYSAKTAFFKETRTGILKAITKYSKSTDIVKMFTEYLDNLSGHKLEYVPYKAATYTAEGHMAYYKCSHCDKVFLDRLGKKETSLEDLTIKSKTKTRSTIHKNLFWFFK